MALGVMRLNVDGVGGGIATSTPVNGSVWVNGNLAVVINGDVSPHGLYYPHDKFCKMVTGSKSVFITGRQACREQDLAECGHVATGSGSVFIN
jgi:uncharacterized Zn-binding protein involved in type VI secretion